MQVALAVAVPTPIGLNRRLSPMNDVVSPAATADWAADSLLNSSFDNIRQNMERHGSRELETANQVKSGADSIPLPKVDIGRFREH